MMQADYHTASPKINHALSLAQSTASTTNIAFCLHLCGEIYFYTAQFGDGIEDFKQAYRLYQEVDDMYNAIGCLLSIAQGLEASGSLEEAKIYINIARSNIFNS
ncbi:MAG: hypothetical protein AAF639_44680 [Chloroflexota bacterium]